MLSRFSPKEQITALANYKSVTDPFSGNSQVIRGGQTLSPGRLATSSGLERGAMAGVNLDTDRLRRVKLDGSVKYGYSSKAVADTINRSFISGGELAEEKELLSGSSGSHAVSGNVRIGNKNKSAYNLSVNISGSYSRSDESSMSQTGNSATYGSSFRGNQLYGNASTVLTLPRLGKPGRFAMMSLNLSGECPKARAQTGASPTKVPETMPAGVCSSTMSSLSRQSSLCRQRLTRASIRQSSAGRPIRGFTATRTVTLPSPCRNR